MGGVNGVLLSSSTSHFHLQELGSISARVLINQSVKHFNEQKCNLLLGVSFVNPETTRPQGPSRGNVWDHAEGISGRREYVF